MTRLNLSEACLLEASGELHDATRRKLHAHLAKHPESRKQLEEIQSQLALLQSMPRLELTDETRRQMAANIKSGIQKKLRQIEWESKARQRSKMIYKALAGISAAAAAIIVVGGIITINHAVAEQERIAAVKSAVSNIASADRSSEVDDNLADIQDSIKEYQDRSSTLAVQDKDMHSLLAVLATVSDGDEIMPPPEPGSL